MRGKIAAACAAVLVGLSPAGALPLASFAAAAATSADSVGQRVETVRVLSIFRSPAGPAPSQAPPAA